MLLKKRSSLEIAGALLFICLLAVAGETVMANDNNTPLANQAGQHKDTALNIQVNHASTSTTDSAQTTPSDSSASIPSADVSSNSPAPSNVSSNMTSTTSNGSTSTQLSINGQQVLVPANGNVQQTIQTPDGTVNVNSSSSQSGSSTSSSASSVNVNISN
jgi:hypothetical protein